MIILISLQSNSMILFDFEQCLYIFILQTNTFNYLEREGHPRVVDRRELELEVVGVFSRSLAGDGDAALRRNNLARGVRDYVRGDLVKCLRGVSDRALRYHLSRHD